MTTNRQTGTGQPEHPANRWSAAFHLFAGLLLFLFGASHLLSLTLRDIGHGLPNTVFPFLLNWMVFLAVAALEITLGVVFLWRRGEGTISVFILTFVATMLWYRWALDYTGGRQCNCLGFLGRLLHVSRTQENVISLAALGILVLTTLPTLVGALLGYLRRRANVLTGFAIAFLGAGMVQGQTAVRVRGDVSLEEFNPVTGKVYEKQRWHSTFEATWSRGAWQTAVTNKANMGWWVRQAYDGTNSYTIWRDGRISTNVPLATVTHSPYPISAGSGLLGDPLVPITYGWSPTTFVTNRAGVVVMPVPWTVVRHNPHAWGYRWVVGGWTDNRFLQSFEVVRDPAFDLADKKELFRPEIDYPETLSDYTSYLQSLEFKRAIPNGWVRARYRVMEWFQTNLLTIPLSAQLEVFSTAPSAKWPGRVFELRATEVELLDRALDPTPAIGAETRVADYRYKRWNSKRIFKYAEYTLQPGSEWPGGQDPELLAAAADWLRNGRKYTRFVDGSRRWFAWILLGFLLAPALAVWLVKKHQQKQQYREEAK